MVGAFLKDARSIEERFNQTCRAGRVALDHTVNRLMGLTNDSIDGRIAAFPRFNVFVPVRSGFDNLNKIIVAASRLKVQPVELDVDGQTAMLTFTANWLCENQLLTWRPNRERVTHLYHQLINNLINSPFSNVQQISIGINNLYDDQLGMASSATEMIIDNQNTDFLVTFNQFGADLANGGLISVAGADKLDWAADATGSMTINNRPTDLVDYVVDKNDVAELDSPKIVFDFPKSALNG